MQSTFDRTAGHSVAITHGTDAPSSGAAAAATDYRTTIHFLTSPSSATDIGSAMDCDRSSPSPDTAAKAAFRHHHSTSGGVGRDNRSLLSPIDDDHMPHDYSASAYNSSASPTPPHHSLPVSLPPIHTASPGDSTKYRDDELTGMAGLMQLASPEHKHFIHSAESATKYPLPLSLSATAPHSHRFASAADAYSSSTSTSNSTGSHAVPPALNISASTGGISTYAAAPYLTPNHQHYSQQQQHHHHSQQQHYHQAHGRYSGQHSAASIELQQSAAGVAALTPDSLPPSATMPRGTRSFPATVDDGQIARRRSQSTDSAQNNPYNMASNLSYVLGNANIRNRSFTAAQRQRTSDTPLFPILLHR
ncbi:hypothetical protein H4R26_002972 [Coemansia thaxteri]|uniref:Uncharacterized protein n=1 Tax=Coemansia thaxteri TaxID=2663907 RepID=A0A9W8BJ07_9FUNG|nr:hypothetical protein H4R26_002972 [Coemansia thaxteri]